MDGHSLSRSGCEPPSPAEIWIKKWLQTHNRMKKRSQIRLMAASAATVTQCLIWTSFFKSEVTLGGEGENQKVTSRRGQKSQNWGDIHCVQPLKKCSLVYVKMQNYFRVLGHCSSIKKIVGRIEEIEHCVVVQQASKLTLETSSNHPSTDKLKLGPKWSDPATFFYHNSDEMVILVYLLFYFEKKMYVFGNFEIFKNVVLKQASM